MDDLYREVWGGQLVSNVAIYREVIDRLELKEDTLKELGVSDWGGQLVSNEAIDREVIDRFELKGNTLKELEV